MANDVRPTPLIIVGVTLAGLLASAWPVESAPAAPSKAVNPHWAADGCDHCHQMQDGQAMPIAPTAVDQLCLQCHDGVRAKDEAHPIGRAFVADRTRKPADWPAPRDVVGCVTCHDIRHACDRDRRRPAANPAFLRDYEPGKLLDFCAHCHLDLAKHEPYSPHIMLAADGEVVRRACQFCHHSLLDERHRLYRHGDPALREETITLCRNCHMSHIDYFKPGHVGAAVSPGMRAYMSAYEQTLGHGSPTRARIGHARSTGEVPVRLPLHNGDTVVCSTCHNPHEAGVFPAESVLAYGAIETGQERQKLRLRGLSKEFCLACHNK